MAQVVYRGVTKRFDDTLAVDHLDLTVDDGELLVLLGPSGCGKTTALRMVAGLETPDDGDIVIGDQIVTDIEPKDRDVAMVFQSYALYPHLSVARNIEFPLRQRDVDADERRRRVEETARSLGLEALLDRKPRQLSGGQRQRVALARAIVRSPQVFLMDEPLSNLDAALRQSTRADIVALQRRLGTTTLYVTHDQVEAMTMGHRIAVMSKGVLQQVDTPERLYNRPANTTVAAFVGSPGMNLLQASLSANGTSAQTAGGEVALEGPGPPQPAAGRAVVIGIRPEDLHLVADGGIRGSVVIVEVLGADVHVVAELAGGERLVVRQEAGTVRPSAGDVVGMAPRPGSVHLFDAESGVAVETAP